MQFRVGILLLIASYSVTASTQPDPVSNSQDLIGEVFIGAPTKAQQLRPKLRFQPFSVDMHGDSGNTGNTDYKGPLGLNSTVDSAKQATAILLWGTDGTLTAPNVDSSGNTTRIGIAAYNPETLAAVATWFPNDASQTLNLAYMEMRLEDKTVLVPTKQGRIYVVQRRDDNGTAQLTQLREVDLASQDVLGHGELLLNSVFDTAGNIWFTSGGVLGNGDQPQPSSTIGYVEPNGTIHKLHIPGQMVENGIALNGTTAYVVTGPSVSNSTSNSTTSQPLDKTGYMFSFTVCSGNEIAILWKTAYDAGSQLKPGAFARGSGTTPALLGSQYIAITDNADGRVNLVILRQDAQKGPKKQVFCQVPLFEQNASANEIGPTVHFDGQSFGVMIVNNYNAVPLIKSGGSNADLNGPSNNMTGMAGGLVRVDVTGCGCNVRWELAEKMKSVPTLSTGTGLVYGYVQDEALAEDGQYTWYVAAIDWRSGDLLWKARTGSGQTFNDNFAAASIGPNGRIYQSIYGGTVWLEDQVAS
ncbi:hypothetical protein BJ170DRAFT_630969 [Xylariales sp. AK1849]|nr:hypothetical protein BJ170DRAFT_630969 [Xylariales sp. AK1849]